VLVAVPVGLAAAVLLRLLAPAPVRPFADRWPVPVAPVQWLAVLGTAVVVLAVLLPPALWSRGGVANGNGTRNGTRSGGARNGNGVRNGNGARGGDGVRGAPGSGGGVRGGSGSAEGLGSGGGPEPGAAPGKGPGAADGFAPATADDSGTSGPAAGGSGLDTGGSR